MHTPPPPVGPMPGRGPQPLGPGQGQQQAQRVSAAAAAAFGSQSAVQPPSVSPRSTSHLYTPSQPNSHEFQQLLQQHQEAPYLDQSRNFYHALKHSAQLATATHNGCVCFYQKGPSSFLGNFAECPQGVQLMIKNQPHTFRCAEAAFQFYKLHVYGGYPARQLQALYTASGDEAFHIGRGFSLDQTGQQSWDQNKVEVMAYVLRCKFQQNPEMAELLKNTGQATLLEHNSAQRDQFWSDNADGTGRNVLGQLLMHVRSELNQGAPSPLAVNQSPVASTAFSPAHPPAGPAFQSLIDNYSYQTFGTYIGDRHQLDPRPVVQHPNFSFSLPQYSFVISPAQIAVNNQAIDNPLSFWNQLFSNQISELPWQNLSNENKASFIKAYNLWRMGVQKAQQSQQNQLLLNSFDHYILQLSITV